jgi:hypothetical protein
LFAAANIRHSLKGRKLTGYFPRRCDAEGAHRPQPIAKKHLALSVTATAKRAQFSAHYLLTKIGK